MWCLTSRERLEVLAADSVDRWSGREEATSTAHVGPRYATYDSTRKWRCYSTKRNAHSLILHRLMFNHSNVRSLNFLVIRIASFIGSRRSSSQTKYSDCTTPIGIELCLICCGMILFYRLHIYIYIYMYVRKHVLPLSNILSIICLFMQRSMCLFFIFTNLTFFMYTRAHDVDRSVLELCIFRLHKILIRVSNFTRTVQFRYRKWINLLI